MRVIYPANRSKKVVRKRKVQRDEPLTVGANLIQVQNSPAWDDLEIERAKAQIGPFLTFLKNNHVEENPAFTSDLITMIDQADANEERAVESLRSFNALVSLTDLLALLGPAVEYAMTLFNDKNSRTPENIERFVISLVLAIAETTSKVGGEKIEPLDPDIISGITVTVRNIMYAFRKDFSKIDYVGEVSFIGALFRKFGGRCLGCCVK